MRCDGSYWCILSRPTNNTVGKLSDSCEKVGPAFRTLHGAAQAVCIETVYMSVKINTIFHLSWLEMLLSVRLSLGGHTACDSHHNFHGRLSCQCPRMHVKMYQLFQLLYTHVNQVSIPVCIVCNIVSNMHEIVHG